MSSLLSSVLGGFTVSDLLVFPSLCEGSTMLSRVLAAAGVSSHLHLPLSIDLSFSRFISSSSSLYISLSLAHISFLVWMKPNTRLSSLSIFIHFSLWMKPYSPPWSLSPFLYLSLCLHPTICLQSDIKSIVFFVFFCRFFKMFLLRCSRPCFLSSSDPVQVSVFLLLLIWIDISCSSSRGHSANAWRVLCFSLFVIWNQNNSFWFLFNKIIH